MISRKGHALLLFTLFVLSGCFAGRKVKKEEDQRALPFSEREGAQPVDWDGFFDNEQSDFYIKRFTAEPLDDAENINSETDIQNSVDYLFKIELGARANRQDLVGHKFRVAGYYGEEVFEDEVNEQNVLSWTERIEFDPMRPQIDPVLVVRKVEGLGSVKGLSRVVFEFNPWANFSSRITTDFRDLTSQREVLKKRYANYQLGAEEFNYIAFLQDPVGSKEARLNLKSARFFFSKPESEIIITQATQGSEDQVMYKAQALPTQFVTKADRVTSYDRGNLFFAESPDYMLREDLLEEAGEGRETLKKDAMILKLKAQIELEREVFLSGKVKDYKPINKGEFLVFAALLGTNQGSEEPLLLGVSSAPAQGKVEGKLLNVELDLFTPYLVNRGDMEIALKVVPVKDLDHMGLKPSGIVYTIGDYNSLKNPNSSFRSPKNAEEGFSFDEHMDKIKSYSEDNIKLLKKAGFTRKAEDVIFSSMQIKFRTVKAGETATQRTVIFNVTTCPFDGIRGTRIGQGREFKVEVRGFDPLKGAEFKRTPLSEIRKDGGDSTIKVRDDNCLSWTDEIAHKYYQKENLIVREYILSSGGKEFTLKGYFNPWDEKYGTLGVDARNLSESFYQEIQEREKLPSRFFMGDFSYMTLRFRYNVDKDMNLTVKKTVLMNMYPFVKRYSNIINGINGNFPIRDGVYLLKVGYQKDYIDPGARGVTLITEGDGEGKTKFLVEGGSDAIDKDKVPFVQDDVRRKTNVHTIKKLIRVENNRVITPVEFEIKDLRTLRIRSNLLVELEPVNQYKLQIVNLFEKKIAKKLGVAVGDLKRFNCMRPGFRDLIIQLFQDTLDNIALAIPDDWNYSSTESFGEVMHLPGVARALSDLASNNLLEAVSKTLSFDLTEQEIEAAFSRLSTRELVKKSATTDSIRTLLQEEEGSVAQIFNGEQVKEINRSVFSTLSALGNRAPRIKEGQAPGESGNYSDFIKPVGEDESELKDGLRNDNILGSSEKDLREAEAGLAERKEPEIEVDESTQRFLDAISVESNLKTLLNNDFTIDPAVARVSDLDLLIDRKAGIVRRTFVGPLTLLALDNKNTLNATDALDYDKCTSDGCTEQSVRESIINASNNEYFKSTYFGYQGQFRNCHVDDFIIREKEIDLLNQAWSECVQAGDRLDKETGEIKIKRNFSCDYEKTQAFRNYVAERQIDVDTQSPFRRYRRLSYETKMENHGQCFYREVWLKKYFAQMRSQKMQRQFSNFLTHPAINARLLSPPENSGRKAMSVTAIKEECLNENYISDECLTETKKHNISTEEIVSSWALEDAHAFIELPYKRKGMFSLKKELDLDPKGAYYKPLKAFYEKHSAAIKDSLLDADEVEIAKDLYDTLIKIAAPDQNLIKYEDRLTKIAPADFDADVYQFVCNIMQPRILKAVYGMMENNLEKESDAYRAVHSPGNLVQHFYGSSLKNCFSYSQSNSREVPKPFILERKIKVLNTGRYFFRGGKSVNFNTGQDVAVSHTRSWSGSRKVDLYNGVANAATGILAGTLIGGPVGGVVGAFLGAKLKVFQFPDYSKSESNAFKDGVSLSQSAHLSMQAAQLDLEIEKYRRCLLIRWNPQFLEENWAGQKEVLLEQLNNSNLFVCAERENYPLAIREDYYYVTQHFTEGDLLDSGSLLNNPWLLTLRGYRDMVAFVTSLYDDSEYSPSVLKIMKDDWDKLLSERPLFSEGKQIPSDRSTTDGQLRAWQTMAKAYRAVTPSFPGIFTVLNNKESNLPDWPWNQEPQIDTPEEIKCDK